MEKQQIYELNPLIYPCRIWVGFNLSDREISEVFYGLDENGYKIDIGDDVSKGTNCTLARCHPVSHKESGWHGVLLNILRKKSLSAGVIAHEAEHIVCWICEELGIESTSFDDSEPRAYLMQWLVDEIWKISRNGKKVD